jgi:hypothetical protein
MDLERLSTLLYSGIYEQTKALRSLAAIAPEEPKKRMVEIWRDKEGGEHIVDIALQRFVNNWRKVGGPFEVDE